MKKQKGIINDAFKMDDNKWEHLSLGFRIALLSVVCAGAVYIFDRRIDRLETYMLNNVKGE